MLVRVLFVSSCDEAALLFAEAQQQQQQQQQSGSGSGCGGGAGTASKMIMPTTLSSSSRTNDALFASARTLFEKAVGAGKELNSAIAEEDRKVQQKQKWGRG